MEGSAEEYDEPFEVSPSPDSVYGAPENESANVCRVAALSTMLSGNRAGIRDVGDQIAALGFPPSLSLGEITWEDIDWSQRLQRIEPRPRATQQWRTSSWQNLVETGEPEAAMAFVIAVLRSELERESAAAAAVLWRHVRPVTGPPVGATGPWLGDMWEDMYEAGGPDWGDPLWGSGPGSEPYGTGGDIEEPQPVYWHPETWTRIYNRGMDGFVGRSGRPAALGLLVRWRFAQALRSPDPITRSLATAAFLPLAEEAVEQQPGYGRTAIPRPCRLHDDPRDIRLERRLVASSCRFLSRLHPEQPPVQQLYGLSLARIGAGQKDALRRLGGPDDQIDGGAGLWETHPRLRDYRSTGDG